PTVEASALPVEVAGTFTSTDSGKGRALLVPKNLTVTSADPAGSVTLDGTCLTIVDGTSEAERRDCTDEAPRLNELGHSKAGGVPRAGVVPAAARRVPAPRLRGLAGLAARRGAMVGRPHSSRTVLRRGCSGGSPRSVMGAGSGAAFLGRVSMDSTVFGGGQD